MGKHPQHQRGLLVGPVVAIQGEHQDAANQVLGSFLQSGGQAKGRRAASLGGGQPSQLRVAVDEAEPNRPAPRGAPARERLEALRARVAAKANC